LTWQSAVSAQLIEQSPTQVTWQLEFALHEMLPLAPRVIEQLAPSLQSTLQESPHAPAHVDCAAQPRVQLAPQVWMETSQLAPAMQAQVVPVHTGAGLVDTPPQAFTVTASTIRIEKRDAIVIAALRLSVMISRYREPDRIRQRSRARATASGPETARRQRGADVAARSSMTKTFVRDLMSSPVEILNVGDSLDLAQHLMKAGRIRHLPVVDGEEHLIGLVTNRKLLAAWVSHGDPRHERPRDIARQIPVDMLMETHVFSIGPNASAAEAARLIETKKIGCLPVVDGGKLVGIVTEADFVRHARKLFEQQDAA